MSLVGSITAIAWLPLGEDLQKFEERSGYLYCDGRALSKTRPFLALFQRIGYSFGSGQNPNNPGETAGDFNVPDLRGRFLRGVDDSGLGRDPGALNRTPMSPGAKAVGAGSIQSDQTRQHGHAAAVTSAPFSSVSVGLAEWKSGFSDGGLFGDGGGSGISRNPSYIGVSISASGGEETRPINAALYWIIKYKHISEHDLSLLNGELE